MNNLFSPSPLWQNAGLTLIRILVGVFMIYHGWETFDPSKIREYTTWDFFKNSSSPFLMVYLGKISELVAGFLIATGLLTRLGCIILLLVMLYICFFIGQAKIWYDDQYPFLFALLALVFFFTGPGTWSFDQLLFNRNKKNQV